VLRISSKYILPIPGTAPVGGEGDRGIETLVSLPSGRLCQAKPRLLGRVRPAASPQTGTRWRRDGEEKAEAALAGAGIPERARTEELGLGEFLEIYGHRIEESLDKE
jgi:hypothetical protein